MIAVGGHHPQPVAGLLGASLGDQHIDLLVVHHPVRTVDQLLVVNVHDISL